MLDTLIKKQIKVFDSQVDVKKEIETAKLALQKEIEGLQAIDSWIGESFVKAVNIIYHTKGKLVVSGMGKSGHVGNKIAATLSSTGTPSFFVHPGEASHGDLGVISRNDAVLLLSNSGETSELKDIVNYCQRFSIPTISIVRRQKSYLVKTSDVSLVLPDSPEASIVNAPTTSTTMMMVLGDLIAVCLLKRKNFDGEKFNIFHPGGKLGSSFLKVKDLMHVGDTLPLVLENTNMKDAIKIMSEKAFGCVGILNENDEMTGLITDGDLRRNIFKDFVGGLAHQFMTENPIVVSKNDLASKSLSIMERKAITNLFVVEDKKPVGILHIHDILKAGVI